MFTRLSQRFDRLLNGGFWKKIRVMAISVATIFMITAWLVQLLAGLHKEKDDDKTVINSEAVISQGNGIPAAKGKETVLNSYWKLYYYFADPGNQMELINDKDTRLRWIGLLMSTFGSIFLSGLLISTITSGFERRVDKWRAGFSYYKFNGHIVIIGSDQIVYGLVNQLCEHTSEQIVIMTSSNVEQMRNSLQANLKDKNNRSKITVNYGLRESSHYLSAINITQAKEVYILGDISEFDVIENFHDSLNMQCLTEIAALCKAANRTELPCHVLFDYKTTYQIFQYADLSSDITQYIEFHPFNFYDFWARKVFIEGSAQDNKIKYERLDYRPIKDSESDDFVHLVVIGMSKMGQAMALQAAHIAHFPNYKKRKTKITFIDKDAMVEMDEFKQKCSELFKVSKSTYIDADEWLKAEMRQVNGKPEFDPEQYITRYTISDEYKHLLNGSKSDAEFIDVEWEFIKGYDHNPVVQRILTNYANDKNAVLTVAVCLNIAHISLRSAMHLPKVYYEKEIPVLVQQRKTASIASSINGSYLEEDKQVLYKHVRPFGMVYDCYDLRVTSLARLYKGINYVYNYYYSHETLPTSIDINEMERLWRELSITKRWSNVYAAASIPTKLHCLGKEWNFNEPIDLADVLDEKAVEMLAEVEHNRWNIEELLLGYRPVTESEDKEIDENKPEKDVKKAKFIHYDIRPYDVLKEDKKGNLASIYDKIIIRSLPVLISTASGEPQKA